MPLRFRIEFLQDLLNSVPGGAAGGGRRDGWNERKGEKTLILGIYNYSSKQSSFNLAIARQKPQFPAQ
jgi:hypothetical protein